MIRWMRGRPLGGILARLLLVNLLVLLVPFAGIEFARFHERQLLASLQRDMRDQSALARELVEESLALGQPLGVAWTQRVIVAAARTTRTRIRVLDDRGALVVDSHDGGPPEGPEPPAPTILPASVYDEVGAADELLGARYRGRSDADRWPLVPDRREVRDALAGRPSAYTRVRGERPSVILFVTEPVRHAGRIAGAIYVTRSTQPVLEELYRIRTGLAWLMGAAFLFTSGVTLALAWSISRPLSRLARAARRIARGDRGVVVPVGGSSEIRDLGVAFASMTTELDLRLRYITEFAADVAHELKSPLTSIRGAAELLAEGAADDPASRERFLHNIVLDADRLDRLVSRLLELSRIDASREPLVPVALGEVIERVVDRTRGGEVAVEARGDGGIVLGREGDLERALLNVVENAQRFAPPGTTVVVEVEQVGEEVRIAVQDRGPGVPVEHRARVFERFFTTAPASDAAREGTGLGLAIVRSVAEAHGGRAYLDEGSEGPGARFVVALPRASRGGVIGSQRA